MAGIRFVLAGSLLFFVERRRGAPLPTLAQWRSAGIIGGLLLLVGNGGVTWAELSIPSGVTALLIGTSPLWFVVLDWLLFDGGKPTRQTALGLAVGLCGVVLLVGPDRILEGGGLSISGILVLMIATAAWAGGSLYSRRVPLPASPFMATAIEMLAGGGLLLVLSLILGEPFRIDSDSVTMKSVLALGYLFLFGSLVGFTAYVWLLRVSTPARVSTYAFVNPVIAVILGWTLGGEEMTGRMMIAALIIVVGVVLIVVRRK
jgi:drug/metabolite transporter (DMT)-like permease